ncbi:MAG: hypothetical protein AB1656_03950 [Candidatus Omnitrophota bacterium]
MPPVESASPQKHMNCVVCGKGFNSVYNEELDIYPIYHPAKPDSPVRSCEAIFYDKLLLIYQHLHGQNTSQQVQSIIGDIDWGSFQLRKEMLMWCLSRGYLALDNLKRIIVPPAVDDLCKDLFAANRLSDSSFLGEAMDYIKSAFRVLRKELKPSSLEPDFDRLKSAEKDQGPDSGSQRRMFTVDLSGAGSVSKTMRRGESRGALFRR